MNKLDKMAAKDAYEYGVAQMFFGEGAGTRRKLIAVQVSEKAQSIPGYAKKFEAAVHDLSQMEMAEKAIAERKRIDQMAKAGKNMRALKSGNLNNLSTGVFVLVAGYYVAHQTGYDKVIAREAKVQYGRLKTEIKFQKARLEGRNVERLYR